MTGGHRKLSTFNLPTKGEDNHQQNFHAALFNMKYTNYARHIILISLYLLL